MIALLAALLLGGLSMDGDLRLEGRGGPAVAGQPTSTGGPAVAGQPTSTGSASADFSVRSGERNLLVLGGIAPQVVVVADTAGTSIARAFTRAFAAVEVRDRESWRFRVRQSVGYGTIDLSPLGCSRAGNGFSGCATSARQEVRLGRGVRNNRCVGNRAFSPRPIDRRCRLARQRRSRLYCSLLPSPLARSSFACCSCISAIPVG